MRRKRKDDYYWDRYLKLPGLDTYAAMRHNAANNAIAHMPAKKERYEEDKFANTLTYEKGYLTATIQGIDQGMPDSALRLLDFLYQELTKNGGNPVVEFLFDEYASHREVTDKKARLRLRQQIEADLEILYKLSFEWRDKRDYIKTRLIYRLEASESKGRVKVNLVPEFAKYTLSRYFWAIDTRLAKLDGRNPNAYKIGRKLWEHCHNPKNRERGIHDRLSVKSLLGSAPDIPTFEEVRDKYGRHYRQKIIAPLETCLECLVDAGIVKEWTWWKAGNEPLTDEELERDDWATLQDCMVHFVLDEPQAIQ